MKWQSKLKIIDKRTIVILLLQNIIVKNSSTPNVTIF